MFVEIAILSAHRGEKIIYGYFGILFLGLAMLMIVFYYGVVLR